MRTCWRSWRRPWGRRVRLRAGARAPARALTLPRRALQALSDIESLKAELEGARIDRKHKEEYEVRFGRVTPRTRDSALPARQVLRKQCLAFPSRADTQAAIAGVVQDIAALEQESAATAATVEVRAQRPVRGTRVALSPDAFCARSSGNSSSGTCWRVWTSSHARLRRTGRCSRFPPPLRRCKWTPEQRTHARCCHRGPAGCGLYRGRLLAALCHE